MSNLWQDLRYGLRMMWKSPGFTLVAVLALALGIGANSAIFSVVNAVVLRPLPYKNSERLCVIWGNLNRPGLEEIPGSASEYVDYKNQSTVFEDIAAFDTRGYNLTGLDVPERVLGAITTANLFPVLGVRPQLGRGFLPEEDRPGHEQVVILSHRLWQRRFGSDPQIVGKSLVLDGKPVEVVGVMPASFHYPDTDTELWKPIAFDAEELSENNRGSHSYEIIARMKPGVTVAQAQAEMNSVTERMTAEHRQVYQSGFRATVRPLQEDVIGNIRTALYVLLVAVGFVLLIACANIANLFLARAAARHKEVAIRTALGASRLRMIRQLLTESVLLSLFGGSLGLLFAMWGVDVLVAFSPKSIPRLEEIGLDARVVLFTAAVSILTGILFGLAPALQASRTDLNEALKEGGRSLTEGRGRGRMRSSLIVTEFALSLVLLIGAGLMIKSFARLERVDPGFKPDNLLTARIALPVSKYKGVQKAQPFFEELFSRLKQQPGVEAVGAINFLPFSGRSGDRSFFIEGRPVHDNGDTPDEQVRFASAGYFHAMSIPVMRGREFTERDVDNAPHVAVINEALARKYFQNEDPLGKRVAFQRDTDNWYEIVGVVGSVRHQGLDAEEKPELYVSFLQPLFADWNIGPMYVVLRTRSQPEAMTGVLRREVMAIDRDQPISDVRTMDERIGESLSERRFNMFLLGAFAAIALLLASVGIYGVISYSVAQRTHEIGIRMALGAQASDVLKLVVGRGMILALAGALIGLIAAAALTRLMASLLYGVSATDPATFIIITGVLTFVALVACYIPARRATRVDPMVALRYE